MSKFHFTKENANSQLNDYINVMFEQRLRAKKNNEPLNDEKYVKETDEMLEEYFLIMEQYPPSNYLDRIGTLLMFGFVSSNSKNKMDEDYAFETEQLMNKRQGRVLPSSNIQHQLLKTGSRKNFNNDTELETPLQVFQTSVLCKNQPEFNPQEYAILDKENQEELLKWLNLTEIEENILLLYFQEGSTFDEIAKKLKMPKTTVFDSYSRIKSKVKNVII